MHPRNLHLYFFSPTGGTQRVAGLFAENLNAADACTDITVHAEAKTFSADDCLLVFFPVYGGRVPGPCLARMRALRGTDTPAVLVAVFGVCGVLGIGLDGWALFVKRRPLSVVRASVACVFAFAGIFAMRFAFYMMHLTVGLGV